MDRPGHVELLAGSRTGTGVERTVTEVEQSIRFAVWCPAVRVVIIPMIIQTIQPAPPGPNGTDDTPHVTRLDPKGADQSDADRPPTDLAPAGEL